MEEHRNQVAVERRLKDALKNDRARIQVGRISAFGLLEMSRQRLRPSLAEASTLPCPHCAGTGSIRSVESTALYVLRQIEEEGIRRRSAEICVYVPTSVALYILNQKRELLTQIERATACRSWWRGRHADPAEFPPRTVARLRRRRSAQPRAAPPPAEIAEDDEEAEEEAARGCARRGRAPPPPRPPLDQARRTNAARRRRRRRRRPRRGDEPRECGRRPAAPPRGNKWATR